jgi:WD40 repeat protein
VPFDIQERAPMRTGRSRWDVNIGPIGWSPCGRYLAYGFNRSNEFCIGDLDDDSFRHRIDKGQGSTSGLTWSPDGKTIAVADSIQEQALRLLDVQSGACRYFGIPNPQECASWSPTDPDLIAVAYHSKPGTIMSMAGNGVPWFGASTWESSRPKDFPWSVEWPKYGGKYPESCSLVWSTDGRHVASGSRRNGAAVLDVSNGKQVILSSYPSEAGEYVAWIKFHDRNCLVTASHRIKIWDVDNQELIEEMIYSGDTTFTSIAASSDGRFCAYRDKNRISFLDATSWNCQLEIRSNRPNRKGGVIAFNPVKPLIATPGNDDHSIDVWRYNAEVLTYRSPF